MNSIAKQANKLGIAAALTALTLTCTQPATHASTHAPRKQSPPVMSLAHLQNASYQIPDLCCGTKTVKLKNGRGDMDGVKVVFGRAVFGKLKGAPQTSALVHIAYHDESLGWMQEVIFIEQNQGRLLQVAEYGLDDGEELQNLQIANGEAVIDTQISPAGTTVKGSSARAVQKVTTIRLSHDSNGCMLKASEWQKDIASGQLKPFIDIRPYIYTVEDRLGKHWAPTQKDRGEHVTVTFKIKPSGAVDDLKVVNSSDVATADQAALTAISKAAPFPPLPAGETQPLEVCFEFQAGVNVGPVPARRQ